MSSPITLSGAPGSPYTRKMLSVLRYRHLAYRFLISGSSAQAAMPQPRVQLLPTFYFPDEDGTLQAVTDSTPIIRRLEREHEGRSVIPTDPALAFLDELIEDYADEWLTKAMFHYRWAYAEDIAKASAILPCWRGYSVPDADLAARGKMFADRQIRNREFSVLVRHCGIRMINYHPVRLHPRMEITRNFQRKRFPDLVVNHHTLASWCVGCNQHVHCLVLEGIGVGVVSNGVT